jgi:hypothetical protein
MMRRFHVKVHPGEYEYITRCLAIKQHWRLGVFYQIAQFARFNSIENQIKDALYYDREIGDNIRAPWLTDSDRVRETFKLEHAIKTLLVISFG